MKRIHLITLITVVIGTGLFTSFDTFELPTQEQSLEDGQAVYDKNGKLLQARYVRKNAHQDDENMQILADAMKKMKEMDCTNPMSWYMQGAIHGAPDTSNYFCNKELYDLAVNDAWHNCTHDYRSLGLSRDDARMHFYTWHKSYLNHFENIIREISGKPDFTLPYWEYDNSKFQTLPALFLDKSTSLYEEYRSAHMNNGNSIQTGADGGFTNPKDAFETNSFYFFTRHLESVPHNQIHNYLGTLPTNLGVDLIEGKYDSTGYMAQMYSPMDPIFWVHHANIDRLYEKWLIEKIDDEIGNSGRPMKQKFIDNMWFYRFFEVGKKEPTHYDDLDKVYDNLYGVQTYAYDMFIDNGMYDQKYEKKVRKAIKEEKWNKSPYQSIDILVDVHEEDVFIGGGAPPQFTLKFDSETPDVKKVKRTIWSLKIDVDFLETPKGSFTVYVKDPNPKPVPNPDPNNPLDFSKKVAGVMTFFGAGHKHSSTNHEHNGSQNFQEVSFEFDVNDEIFFDFFSGEIEFEIIPSDVTDRAIIDKIQLIKQVVIKSKK